MSLAAMECVWKVLIVRLILLFSYTVSCRSGIIREIEVENAECYPCQDLDFPFCNVSSPIASRVQDVLTLLTLQEKIEQLGNLAPSIPRLGIPSYQWWQEALHGVAVSPGVNFTKGPATAATSFPQPILTAGSFNASLFYQIAQIVSTEARAMFNLGQTGLTFWSPNVNIFRDPRWGRGQETPGEDPFLAKTYAVNFVRGMQSMDNSRIGSKSNVKSIKLKTSSCCKHFTAYDLENWEGVDRDHFDAVVSKQDLEDTYNPPFQACAQEGGASGLMCSYNRLNGVPTCGDYNLLTETARNSWGFNGYIVSDCDAVYDMINEPKYAADLEDAVAYALQAGMDLNCGITIQHHAEAAYAKGKVSLVDIDRALSNLLFVRFRLGLFDGNPQDQEFGNLGLQDICKLDHLELALDAALQSIVLLKNQDNILPLSQEAVKSLAVIGPSADDKGVLMLGNYAGIPCEYITPYQGLAGYVSNVSFSSGCTDTPCKHTDFSGTVSAVENADAVVIVVGLSQDQEKEGLDRTSLLLPGQQQDLVNAAVNSSRGSVILVIMSGGPIDVSFAKNDNRISSILWVGYPGQAGGLAIAKIIFGDHNPGGRLPVTWYPESFMQVPMTDMNMRPNITTGYPGRTYRFYTGETVFKFGDGLSYTTFTHLLSSPTKSFIPNLHQQTCHYKQGSGWELSKLCSKYDTQVCSTLNFHVKVVVKNTGSRSGTDVVLLYAAPPHNDEDGSPLKHLIGFQRLQLEAGSEHETVFEILPCRDLSTVKADGIRSVDVGVYTLSLGDTIHQSIMLNVQDSA